MPHLFGTTSHCLSVQPFQLLPSRSIWRSISFWLGLSPLDTSTPDSPLMLLSCFTDFAIEHWFGCCTTEPGFARNIGAIEIWLIDRLIDITDKSCGFVVCRCGGAALVPAFPRPSLSQWYVCTNVPAWVELKCLSQSVCLYDAFINDPGCDYKSRLMAVGRHCQNADVQWKA